MLYDQVRFHLTSIVAISMPVQGNAYRLRFLLGWRWSVTLPRPATAHNPWSLQVRTSDSSSNFAGSHFGYSQALLGWKKARRLDLDLLGNSLSYAALFRQSWLYFYRYCWADERRVEAFPKGERLDFDVTFRSFDLRILVLYNETQLEPTTISCSMLVWCSEEFLIFLQFHLHLAQPVLNLSDLRAVNLTVLYRHYSYSKSWMAAGPPDFPSLQHKTVTWVADCLDFWHNEDPRLSEDRLPSFGVCGTESHELASMMPLEPLGLAPFDLKKLLSYCPPLWFSRPLYGFETCSF